MAKGNYERCGGEGEGKRGDGKRGGRGERGGKRGSVKGHVGIIYPVCSMPAWSACMQQRRDVLTDTQTHDMQQQRRSPTGCNSCFVCFLLFMAMANKIHTNNKRLEEERNKQHGTIGLPMAKGGHGRRKEKDEEQGHIGKPRRGNDSTMEEEEKGKY